MRFGDMYKEMLINQELEASLVLNEGLITSYPPNKLKDLLNSHFQIGDKNIRIGTLNVIVFDYNLDISKDEKFIESLNYCGYTLSKLNINNSTKRLEYTIEPKFSSILNKVPDHFYHITPITNLPKIKQYGGLVSKVSKTSFSHSGDRIYLFVTATQSDLFDLASLLHSDRSKNFVANQSNQKICDEYAVLQVTSNRNNTYYLDPSLQIRDISPTCFGVFTLKPIKLNEFKQLGKIKL